MINRFSTLIIIFDLLSKHLINSYVIVYLHSKKVTKFLGHSKIKSKNKKIRPAYEICNVKEEAKTDNDTKVIVYSRMGCDMMFFDITIRHLTCNLA